MNLAATGRRSFRGRGRCAGCRKRPGSSRCPSQTDVRIGQAGIVPDRLAEDLYSFVFAPCLATHSGPMCMAKSTGFSSFGSGLPCRSSRLRRGRLIVQKVICVVASLSLFFMG